MLKLAADENFNNDIIRGLKRRITDIDIVRVQDTALAGAVNEEVLEWAAQEGRVLLTHDVSTMTACAYARVSSGRSSPGIFEVDDQAGIGAVIEDLVLLCECSRAGEWEGQVRYIPLA